MLHSYVILLYYSYNITRTFNITIENMVIAYGSRNWTVSCSMESHPI